MTDMTFAVSDKLVCLERDTHVILYDGHHLTPVRVERGGWDLVGALRRMRQPTPYDQIVSEIMPAETLEFLHEIGIIESDRPIRKTASTCASSHPAPTRDTIDLTILVQHSCNLGCVYCLNGPDTYRVHDKSSVSIDTAIGVIAALRRARGPDCHINISFFGGEPMLAWKRIVGIIDHCNAAFASASFNITTNLSLLPAGFLETARRNEVRFAVNIDGPQPIHDRLRPFLNGRPSFDAVSTNVRRLVDAGIDLQLRMLLTAHNDRHMHQTIDLHRALGAPVSIITPLRGANSDGDEFGDGLYASPETVREQMTTLLDSRLGGTIDFHPAIGILKQIMAGERIGQYCGASVGDFPILDNQGDIYNCVWFVGKEEFRMGRFDAETGKIAYDMERDHSFKARNGIEDGQACRRCSYREMCGGPCPATRIMGSSPHLFETERRLKCAMTKPIVDFFMESLVSGCEFRLPRTTYAFAD